MPQDVLSAQFGIILRYCLMFFFPKDPGMVCPILRKGFPIQSYSRDGIKTINPTLGKGLNS